MALALLFTRQKPFSDCYCLITASRLSNPTSDAFPFRGIDLACSLPHEKPAEVWSSVPLPLRDWRANDFRQTMNSSHLTGGQCMTSLTLLPRMGFNATGIETKHEFVYALKAN
jgi:hypothetical protein